MLNRPRLIEAFRDEFDATKESAQRAVDWLFDQMAAELAKGGEVNVRDFGTLKTKRRAAGKARNLHTGEEIATPAKTVVRFKAGRGLVALVNGG